MTAPCPKCERAKCLHEKKLSDGCIRHECRSCGYLMIWHPRRVKGHVQPQSVGIMPYA